LSVEALWIQPRRPAIRAPVSSKCATGAPFEQRAKTLVEVAQPAGRRRDPFGQRARRHSGAGQVTQRLAGPLVGHVLKDVQVDAQRAHAGAVLRRRPNRGRERPGRDVPALTAPPRGDVLDDPQRPLLGQVEHLTRLAALQPLGAGQIGLAGIAALRRMLDLLVRNSHRQKPRPPMLFLTTLLASRRTPQAALLGIDRRL